MKARTKQLLYPVIALGFCAAGAAAMMATKSPPEKKPFEKPIPFVATAPVELDRVQLSARSQGLVEPRFRTQLVAQVSGEVIAVAPAFVKGGIVKKGEVLAQIDPFNYEVKVQQAEANLASARAAFILERAQGQVAEAEWEKITNAKPSELGLRKPQQEQALAAVKAAEASLKQAQKDLQRTEIIAPFNAVVAEREASPGTFVSVGAGLGTLLDVSVAEVRLPVMQDELQYLVGFGLDAEVELQGIAAGQQSTWRGRIVRDEGVIDAESRMMYLVAEIPDPYGMRQLPGVHPHRLPFGTFVSARIGGRELPAAAVVPRQVVRENQVAVVEDDTLRLKPVEVARHLDKVSIIAGGLSASDVIVTSALANPVDGMKVQWQRPQASVAQETETPR